MSTTEIAITSDITPEQRTAARVAGFLYLLLMATLMFAELYARGPQLVRGDAAQTARNIAATERLFRIGTVTHLLTVAGDVILLVALYVVLRAVNRNVALLAALWRVVETAVFAVAAIADLTALRILRGGSYFLAFEPAQLQALARLFLTIRTTGFQTGFAFLGLGSAVFSWLWLRSRYIPRPLAAWGIFSSLLLATVSLATMIVPTLPTLGLGYMAPMFVYEVGLGLWLLVKGLRPPGRPR